MLDYQLYGTQWRKSDPTICAAALRLTTCGCNTAATATMDADTRASALASALAPAPPTDPTQVVMRAFPLGTWSGQDQLPAGCEYVDVGVEANGQPSRAIVSCRLAADDVLNYAGDLKEQCRRKYGDNVVVHVPLPADAISCSPAAGVTGCDGQPWVMR
jgi:hypothetical protein